MLRVPGSRTDLFRLKSTGAVVRIVYSPLDCLRVAQSNPERQVVFFAIGFETTAPANAMTVHQARQLGIRKFSLLVSYVRVPPAITSILQSPYNRVQGFLVPAHVCTIMGYQEYQAISAAYEVPIVITGFEPLDILEGVFRLVRQLEEGQAEVENQYSRVVTHSGNLAAHQIIWLVFAVCDQKWRGVGTIPQSGYKLRPEFKGYDAAQAFAVEEIETEEPAICISGQILRVLKKPHECPAFGKQCTPQRPLGATMVSAEGACAACFNYGRHLDVEPVASRPKGVSRM
jgi:hydrogenase expression/formation protein HypD